MQQNRIVIDCDPGIDDTFALILCIKKLDVAGIVAVGGNTGLRFTSRNARYVTELTGRTDIPVYAGYDQPMLGNAVRAEYGPRCGRTRGSRYSGAEKTVGK